MGQYENNFFPVCYNSINTHTPAAHHPYTMDGRRKTNGDSETIHIYLVSPDAHDGGTEKIPVTQ